VVALGLPAVTFMRCAILPHQRSSLGGRDVLSVSRRLGHSTPAITLNICSHRFQNKDEAAAAPIEAAM
jgi:hypothetical protein